MPFESDDAAAERAAPRKATLRTLAHDLGNLASRLTMLSANLQAQIPDSGRRAEAVSLVDDTAQRLREIIARVREVERDL